MKEQLTLVAQALEEFQEKLSNLEEKITAFDKGVKELKYELEKCRDDLR